MNFELTILGCSSAAPAFKRHPTAQLLNYNGEFFLIDCGEGTQMQLARYRLSPQKINYIFISHLHGDHYLGLLGLLSSMHLFGRRKPLQLFGPAGLQEIITTQLYHSHTVLNYNIVFYELGHSEHRILLDDHKYLTVESLPLNHHITCNGFLFREKPGKRKINKSALPDDLPVDKITQLKEGKDIKGPDGRLQYRNEDLTYPPKEPRSYAYCSDTSYEESLVPYLKNVDLLYHESTFTKDLEQRARDTFHATAEQAAGIAQQAGVGKLLLGHFSSRYKSLDPLLKEAESVFKNSYLAAEGDRHSIERS